MADKETGLNIPIGAYADEQSAEKAVKDISKKVDSSLKDGRIEIPVELKAPIKGASSELLKAQEDVIKKWEAASKKGFSSSSKEVNSLIDSYTNFKRLVGQAHKSNMTQIKDLDAIIGKKIQSFRIEKTARRAEQKEQLKRAQSANKKSSTKRSKNFGLPSDEEIENDIKQDLKRKSKGLSSITNKLDYKSKSGADPSRTTDQMMRLSEYSAHGSNWANELARTLKEETAEAAKHLTKWIEPNYKPGTRTGKEKNAIELGNKTPGTTEKEFLTDTLKSARNELKSYIAQLEAGSEEITLDMLKETAAVIKVLNSALGKTTEQAEKAISSAIQGRYSDRATKRLGGTSLEPGQEKGVGIGHENTQKLVSKLYEVMKQWDSEVVADTIAKEMVLGNERAEKKRGRSRTESKATTKITDLKSSESYKAELEKLNGATDKTFAEMRKGTKATQAQTRLDRIENVREAVADSREQNIQTVNRDINKDTAGAVKNDADTGFNTTSKADELIHAVEKEDEIKLPDDITDILKAILTQITVITTITKSKEPRHYKVSRKTGAKTSNEDRSFKMKAAHAELGEAFEPIKNALIPVLNSVKKSVEIPKAVSKSDFDKIVPKILKEAEQPEGKVQKSNIYASPIKQTIWDKLEDGLNRLTGATKEYEEVMNAAADEQDRFAAERITKYGLNNGRNPNDTGDIASIRRALELFRTNKRSIEDNKELSQKIQLTKGVEVDTTKITKALNDTLSGKQMRIAQMGGSIPRQILGGLTGFVGMPSLEKSRAQADGLNQILGNINKALNSVLSSIQMKETELKGLEEAGKAKFDDKGNMIEGTSSARKTFVDLEEYKLVLSSILADMETIDTVVDSTNGKFSKLVKRLNFTSPVLRENNDILRNINAGLDKGGKALKFQTRWAEILNYTFQLMSRSIGQMLKNAISKIGSLLNPINWIKNAAGIIKNLFSDFGSYDTKWQRTMNVIKINFQRIIKPAMEWIAQKIVNLIGYFDVASQAFQRVFGKIPISLFDQAGADAEKIHREMEEAANVTLGFDELHDIGTDQSGANDLLGDIYKPQLDPKWVKEFEKLGEVLGKFFKGDLGFGDVCKQILKMLGMLLGDIGKAIWDWFKQTAIGKFLTDNWKAILAGLLAAFLAWKLLKIAGSALFNALFGKLLQKGVISGIFSKIGGWISGLLGSTGFGSGILMAFQTLFAGGKYSLIGTLKEMFTNSAAITQAGSWGSMIGFALTKGLLAVLAGYATYKITDYFGDKAVDNENYNLGLMSAGGEEKDKKSNVGNVIGGVLGGIGGGAITGGIIGGPVGAAIGAVIGGIAGTIQTVLRPALEEAQVASRNLNNELQNMSYYEGVVKGASTEVENFTEVENLMKQAVEDQTNKVYAQGEQLGITKTRMDELVRATQDGTFNTDMLSSSEQGLAGSLTQLSGLQDKNRDATDKLTEAKRKLAKAEMDQAIAEDIAAGHFEIAAARIEAAFASEVYTGEQAGQQMALVLKQTNDDMKANLLEDMTPDMKANFAEYVQVSETGKKDLVKIYNELNDEQKKAFEQNYADLFAENIEETLKEGQDVIDRTELDWSHPFQSIGKVIGGIWSTITGGGGNKARAVEPAKMAIGTNYVPHDGLAYLHQGEAVIPKKYNQPYQPTGMSQEERNYMSQMMNIMSSLNDTMKQGINVSGEFRQRGSDLVAVTEKAKNRNGHQPLNNPVFAR